MDDSRINPKKNPDANVPKNANVWFVLKLAIIASFSGLLFGYDTGVVSGAAIFIQDHMEISDFEIEIMVSITILSAALSALAGGPVMKKTGRKMVLTIASIIFIVGSLLMGLSFGPKNGYYVLVIGRFIVGIAIGLASEAGPVYIAEVAPPEKRGGMITLFNIAVVSGQVGASLVCGGFSYLPDTINWRLMLGFGSIPAFFQLVGFRMLPKSPQWLARVGRLEETEKILKEIRATDDVSSEFNDIMEEVELANMGAKANIFSLWLFHPAVRKAMIIGCLLWVLSQLAGINTVMYYGAMIVNESGITSGFEESESFDIWITAGLSMMQLLGILICLRAIDFLGRRKTVLFSICAVFLFLIVIATGFAKDWSIVTVVGLCGYLLSFGFGLSTMPYTINAEIYPIQYRSICVAQATSLFWLSNFVVSLTFLTLSDSLGSAGTFYLYAGIVAVGFFLVFFLLPETSGLSLEEIQQIFKGEPIDISNNPPTETKPNKEPPPASPE